MNFMAEPESPGFFKCIHKFKYEITNMLTLFSISVSQQQYVCASSTDGIWYDKETDKEIDLDDLYGVDLIRNI